MEILDFCIPSVLFGLDTIFFAVAILKLFQSSDHNENSMEETGIAGRFLCGRNPNSLKYPRSHGLHVASAHQ